MWYWESTATAGNGSNAGGLGLANLSFPNNPNAVGTTANSLGFGYGGDQYFLNWSGAMIFGSPGPGSAINIGTNYMFALDMDNGRMWIGQNGTWYNGGNPSTGANPTMTGLGASVGYPAVTFNANSINAFTANFGGSLFANQVPSGFNPGFYGSIVKVGYPNQFSQYINFGQDYLLGEQITVTQPCTLMRLGLISVASGMQVKMGLYSESGGNPSTLLAQIPATNVIVGNNEVPTSQVSLAPGNYWLMADYNATGKPSQEPSNTTTNTYKYIGLPFANALPSPFPAPTVASGVPHFNYYIVVAQ
jgi:hypothetical protein